MKELLKEIKRLKASNEKSLKKDDITKEELRKKIERLNNKADKKKEEFFIKLKDFSEKMESDLMATIEKEVDFCCNSVELIYDTRLIIIVTEKNDIQYIFWITVDTLETTFRETGYPCEDTLSGNSAEIVSIRKIIESYVCSNLK